MQQARTYSYSTRSNIAYTGTLSFSQNRSEGCGFGFNGQMRDDEVYGAGNSYTAEHWQYDTRLGRRWNIDPKVKPWMSRYVCFSNNPISRIDPNGADDYLINADGTITVVRTEDTFNTYKYQASDGSITDLGTFNKTDKGYVQFTAGISYITKAGNEDHMYLHEDAAAALLGASMNYLNQTGLKIEITQLTDVNGKHSGAARSGKNADVRYANKNGNENKTVYVSDEWYDKDNSQILADEFIKFGFTDILTENAAGNGAELEGTRYVNGKNSNPPFHHRHHMHLQGYSDSNISEVDALNLTVTPPADAPSGTKGGVFPDGITPPGEPTIAP